MPRISIIVKYSFLVLFSIGATSGLLSWFVLDLFTTEVSQQLDRRGETAARQLAYSLAPLLLSKDDAKIGAALNSVLREPDIVSGAVLDADLRPVAGSDDVEVGQPFAEGLISPHLKQCDGRLEDAAQERLVFMHPALFSGVRVGCVLIQISQASLARGLARATERVLFLTAVIALVVIALSFLTLRRTLRPLSQVIEGTRRVAAGDFSTRLKTNSRDEIGDLADAFNGMAAKTELFFRYLDKSIAKRLAEDESLARPGGQLKQVSVLFGDMRNFTGLSNERTPKEVVRILNAYFDLFFQVVEHYRGVVDKTMGDAIIAFFEPARSNDTSNAHRATLAAVAMRASVTSMQQILTEARRLDIPVLIEPCQFGFAVATGRLIVGNIGSERHMDYTVCGPAVNLAARLQEDTRRGEIIVDRFTAMDAEDLVACAQLPQVLPKGFAPSQEVTPYQITAVRPAEMNAIRDLLTGLFSAHYFSEHVLPVTLDNAPVAEDKRRAWLERLASLAASHIPSDPSSFLIAPEA